MFEQKIEMGISFREAIQIREPCFFDEVFMPAICKEAQVIQYGENMFADILPQYGSFVIAPICAIKNEEQQSFFWQNGRLYREYAKGIDELMYIHLQKRPMKYTQLSYDGKIYITPQGFFAETEYNESCQEPNSQQRKCYQKKRWASLSFKKIWIKLKVKAFKERL